MKARTSSPSAARSRSPPPSSHADLQQGRRRRSSSRTARSATAEGQVGPFPLETYEQARKRAVDLAAVVEDRVMPPWKAVPERRAQVQA